MGSTEKKLILTGTLLLGLVVTILILNPFYTVKSGYVGVLSTFGKYDEQEKEPGIHVKIPVIQKVKQFNVKLHSINYKGMSDLVDTENITNKPAIKVLDSKNLPIGIEMTIQYTPVKTQASEILQEYGSDYVDVLINPIVRDVVRDIIGQYKAEDIAKDRTKIANAIKAKLEEKFKKIPFVLNDVLLRDIQLPEVIVKKIQEVQIAKQEEQRLSIIEQQALKRQKIKKIEAETKLIEVTTQAKAQAEKQKIEADAKAYRILKEAQAQQKANQLIAKSLTPDLIKYNQIIKWNGELPQTLLQKDGGILLNVK